jgi:hypothetical protein
VVTTQANSPGISVNASTAVGYIVDLRGPDNGSAVIDEADQTAMSAVGGMWLGSPGRRKAAA